MSEVIDSLLVRLGLETDAKDFREANALFDSVKTKALQFGAVIGAGVGLQSLTFGFAAAKDELAEFAELYGTTAQFVDSLGYALERSGGQARDAFGSIKRIRDLLEDTEWGEVAENAFRVAGFDPYLLEGVTDVTEAYERLAGAVQGLSQEDARRALSSLGFSDAEIRLFRSGPESLRQTLAEAESYARVTKEMTDKASRFSAELTKLTKAVEGVSNEFSNLILDDFSDAMKAASDYLRNNRSEIASFFEKALPWLEATAVGIGTLVALQGGMRALSMLGSVARLAGPVAGVALAYQFHKENPDHLQDSWDAAKASVEHDINQLGHSLGVDWLKKFGHDKDETLYDQYGYERLLKNPNGPAAPPIPGEVQRTLAEWEAMRQRGELPPTDYVNRMNQTAPAMAPGANGASVSNTYEIHVDARGATSPGATEEAAERGAEAALARMASQAVIDMRDVE